MVKRKQALNNFKVLAKLKLIYVYQTIFQALRVAHFAAKLGFQKVQKCENCLIEGAIFLKFWPSHCFKTKLIRIIMYSNCLKKNSLYYFFNKMWATNLNTQSYTKNGEITSPFRSPHICRSDRRRSVHIMHPATVHMWHSCETERFGTIPCVSVGLKASKCEVLWIFAVQKWRFCV